MFFYIHGSCVCAKLIVFMFFITFEILIYRVYQSVNKFSGFVVVAASYFNVSVCSRSLITDTILYRYFTHSNGCKLCFWVSFLMLNMFMILSVVFPFLYWVLRSLVLYSNRSNALMEWTELLSFFPNMRAYLTTLCRFF